MKFFEFTLDKLNKEFNFDENFGVTPESLSLAKDVCKEDIDTFINRGMTLAKRTPMGKNE